MTGFGSFDGHTIGVEEEMVLVDPETREAVSRSHDVVPAAPEDRSENVQYEFYQSMVEMATDPCSSHDELRDEVHDLRNLVAELARDAGADVAATGTHPTARWQDGDVTDKPRYQETIDLVGWPCLWELVCGHHVHVAVPSREDAVAVHNRLRVYLPYLLALSANSPFWAGEATGYMSSRLPIWDAMPRSGLPRAFDGWDDFVGTVDALKEAGVVDDVTRLWWDVRPRPELGTVEVRVADMPTTAEDSLAIAGFVQALVAWICRSHREDDLPVFARPEVIEENRERAQRHGAHARFVRPTPGGMEEETVPEAVERVAAHLEPVAADLGVEDALDRVRAIAKSKTTGADRQLEVRDRAGSFEAVVDDVVQRTVPRS